MQWTRSKWWARGEFGCKPVSITADCSAKPRPLCAPVQVQNIRFPAELVALERLSNSQTQADKEIWKWVPSIQHLLLLFEALSCCHGNRILAGSTSLWHAKTSAVSMATASAGRWSQHGGPAKLSISGSVGLYFWGRSQVNERMWQEVMEGIWDLPLFVCLFVSWETTNCWCLSKFARRSRWAGLCSALRS